MTLPRVRQKLMLIRGRLGHQYLFWPGLGIASLICCLTETAFAQTENSVTLSYDEGEAISGELIEFSNGSFKIKTLVGTLTVPGEGVWCIGNVCPDFKRPELTTTSLDGTLRLKGKLKEISNNNYVIATAVGEMIVDVTKVTCVGDGCVASEN